MFISLFSLIYEFPKCDEEPFCVEINKGRQILGFVKGI